MMMMMMMMMLMAVVVVAVVVIVVEIHLGHKRIFRHAPAKRRHARNHLITYEPERVDVRLLAVGLVLGYLWGHVPQRARSASHLVSA